MTTDLSNIALAILKENSTDGPEDMGYTWTPAVYLTRG